MTVRKFRQPSFTTDDAATYKKSIDDSIAVAGELATLFAPSEMAAPGMGVTIAAGMDTFGHSVAATNVAGIGAPAANPRIDRIWYDMNTGTYTRTVGTEAAAPVPPAVPFGKFLICDVRLIVGQTQILNADITDIRSFVMPPYLFGDGGYLNVVDLDGLFRILIGRGGVDNRIIMRMHNNNGSSKIEFQDSGGTAIAFLTDKGVLQFGKLTVATLPAASAALEGARAYVTDSNTAVFAANVAGGGANKVPVYCDGANWKVG
jgi:hypothetical protein